MRLGQQDRKVTTTDEKILTEVDVFVGNSVSVESRSCKVLAEDLAARAFKEFEKAGLT